MWTRLLVLLSRVRAVVSGRRVDADLNQEIDAHLALLTEDNIRRGMTRDEARRQARLRFGGVAQLAESQREQRGFPGVDIALRDVRFALRVLRKTPGFTAVAVLTLAVGIGASTTMFSVARAVLLRPLPYEDPNRLVRIFEANPLKRWTRNVVAPANFSDWQKQNTVFTEIAAYNGTDDEGKSRFSLFLTGSGEPQRLKALSVSANLMRVLGVAPMLGRSFTDDENFEGKGRVVILSSGVWQRLFAGDPRIVGRTMSLSGRTYDVIGVMPSGFFFPGRDVQLWVPFGYKPSVFAQARRPHWLSVIARRRPGVSLARAEEEMTAIAARLERTYPDTNTKMGVRLEGFHDSMALEARTPLLMLLAAVGFLFLIVCVNLANLQLGRAAGRAREMTIRQALGASRGRLIQQLLTEGLVLSMLGGAAGLAVAAAGRAALLQLAPSALPIFADLRIDRAVLIFNLALSMVAPIVFGLVPAVSSSRADALNDRSESTAPHHRSTRAVLVACEVALSVMLVIGAGLLLRSLIQLQKIDPGFDRDHVVAFTLTLPGARYPDDADALRAFREIERRIREQPGIQAVGATSTLALRGFTWTGDATVEGRSADDYERELRHESITPDYFRALGARLLAGRFLNESDGGPNAPKVTLVNETLAKKYFRGADALGKRITFGRPRDNEPWVTIVGIVADAKQDGLDAPVQPEVYVPLADNTQNQMTLVVRAVGSTDGVLAAARAQVQEVDKDLALTDVTTLGDLVQASVGDQRFRTSLLSGFAGVALFLAALGIYGVLAYHVTQGRRELGIRLALGAPPTELFTMVVGQGMRPVLAGAAAGLAGAYATTALMTTLLFGIQPLDPATYALTTAILGVVALCACAVPASRATRVDPLVALREE
jgi:putative ABC transport system permease protein